MSHPLRDAARGKPCQMRLPECSHDKETVVLAHINRGGVGGMGMRAPDACSVFACHVCHDIIDGRRQGSITYLDGLDTYILEAMCRTIEIFAREGLL